MEQIQVQELTKLTPTKTNVEVVSRELTQGIIDGEVDAIEFSVRCKFAIETLKKSLDIAEEVALKKGVSKDTKMLGASLEESESGIKYDYSQNEAWNQIVAELKPLLEKKTELEEKIKNATKMGQSIINEDTGEIIASPVKKTSTTILKITLGK